jgi:hypothetical protein
MWVVPGRVTDNKKYHSLKFYSRLCRAGRQGILEHRQYPNNCSLIFGCRNNKKDRLGQSCVRKLVYGYIADCMPINVGQPNNSRQGVLVWLSFTAWHVPCGRLAWEQQPGLAIRDPLAPRGRSTGFASVEGGRLGCQADVRRQGIWRAAAPY